jgi:hypothetical protein
MNYHKLKPGMLAAERTTTHIGHAIRATLGCVTNHNKTLTYMDGRWYWHEAIPYKSVLTPVETIDPRVTMLRIYDLPDLTEEDRLMINFASLRLVGTPYPTKHSLSMLALYRVVNNIPFKLPMLPLESKWCTQLMWDILFDGLGRDPLPDTDGESKANPTPRTFENRVIAGLVKDVTEEVV